MNYEYDLRIDETALDVEWLEQTAKAMKWGKYWAECKEQVTRAEEKIKVVKAELVKEANEDPDHYLGEGVKPTGPNVESYYRTHKRHKEAKEEWIEAVHECNIAEIAKWEIGKTRKEALQNLVQLHGQQYFAGPSIPRNLREEREMWNKKIDRKIGSKIKRTTKS